MHKKQRTFVFYHVPEDKDVPSSPNVFAVPLPSDRLTLAHIHQYFPLRGTYAFRFKIAFDSLIVWLDLNNMDQTLPTFKNQIHIKANRLSWQDSKVTIPTKTPANPSKISENKKQIDIFDHHQETPKEKTTNHNKANFQDFEGMNLLDSNNHHNSHSSSTANNQKIDFFSMQNQKQNPPQKSSQQHDLL